MKNLRQWTANPINWFDIYGILIEAGFTEFGIVKLRRLPIKFVQELAEKAVNQIKVTRNIRSLATANLGVLMYQLGMCFLDGDKGEKVPISVKNFLPHPELIEDEKPKLSSDVERVLRYLLKNDSIGSKIAYLVPFKV